MSPERGRGHCARTPDPCNTATWSERAGSASPRKGVESGFRVGREPTSVLHLGTATDAGELRQGARGVTKVPDLPQILTCFGSPVSANTFWGTYSIPLAGL